MTSREVVRDAFDTLCRCAVKVKTGSEKWNTFVSMASVLGWVLELPTYTENTEELLKVLRGFAGSTTVK